MSIPKTFYSVQKASDVSGNHRSTILRQIKAGKFKAEKDDKNQWWIDPADFHRMHPLPSEDDQGSAPGAPKANSDASPRHAQGEFSEIIALVRTTLEQVQSSRNEEVKSLHNRIDFLEDHIEKQSEQLGAMTKLITHQTATPPEEPEQEPTPKKRSFWEWFAGI